MGAHVCIRLEGLGEETTRLCGSVSGQQLLELEQSGTQSVGEICYEISVCVYGGKELVAEVQMDVPLKLRCERCLREFEYNLPMHAVINREVTDQDVQIDIAEELREEILLAMPAYPKCEMAGQECEIHDINGDFGLDKAPLPGVNSGAASERSVWDVLDGIGTPSVSCEDFPFAGSRSSPRFITTLTDYGSS